MFLTFGLCVGTAFASGSAWGVAVGGHGSIGLKTQIPVTGIEGGLVYRWQEETGVGIQIELQDVWGLTSWSSVHLLGIKVSGTRLWGDTSGVHRFYSTAGLGGYVNDVMPVLPLLWLETGLEVDTGSMSWRLGPTLYGLPPFFVGGGLRLTVTHSVVGL